MRSADSSRSERHFVTATWTTGAIRCAGCDESWEQPYYAAGEWLVCPHCLHAAPTPKKEAVALPQSIFYCEKKGASPAEPDDDGCQMCGVPAGDPCDCFDPQEGS